MSLSWPSLAPAVHIALLPGQAAVSGNGRDPATRAAAPGWPATLAALDSLLDQLKPRGAARVILSHHFARLFLLPAPPTWLRPAEMRLWLRERLAPALGEAGGADDWRFAWDLTPPGQPVAVAALAADDLEALLALLARRGLAAARIRPWFAAAWNSRRHKIGGRSGWYALLEPGRLALGRVDAGRLAGLCLRQTAADPSASAVADLADVLAREALLSGARPGGPLWLELAGVRGDWSTLPGEYATQTLSNHPDAAQGLLK